jgi:hypothetical protein
MIQLPLCGRVAENTPRNDRFWTPDGRRRYQLDAASIVKFQLFRVNHSSKESGNQWDKNCEPNCSEKPQPRAKDASPQVPSPHIPFGTKSQWRALCQSYFHFRPAGQHQRESRDFQNDNYNPPVSGFVLKFFHCRRILGQANPFAGRQARKKPTVYRVAGCRPEQNRKRIPRSIPHPVENCSRFHLFDDVSESVTKDNRYPMSDSIMW